MKSKKTPLYRNHIELSAKMVDFAGYQMPIQYKGIKEEHNHVRSSAGLFDVSHMGEIIVSGNKAEDFLDRMLINDVKKIQTWDAQYSAMCNENGGIIDDLIVYRYPEHYMLVVNASNIQKNFDWLIANKDDHVDIFNLSEKINIVAIQGPASRIILSKLIDFDLSKLEFYKFMEIPFSGKIITISRTGYTGELGYEIYAGDDQIIKIWNDILDIGDGKVFPAGLGCRDTLRMEMNYPLYGNDLNEKTNPIEAGLSWITKLNQREFVGSNRINMFKKNYTKKSVCLEMIDKGIPRKDYSIKLDNIEIGHITSGTYSPSLSKGIAIGLINKDLAVIGSVLDVEIRNRTMKCKIVKPPFYKDGSLLS